ncbi:MAG TPA: nitrilase-related carbon-nitrogen hydrolase [Bacteroidales bacterium]|nr:nitrilase-related carbon-nitrogen hydrolase [Bacteroidales bacterium]
MAALTGSHVISFHECSVTGYTFARHLSKGQMLELAELVPDGPSVRELIHIAARNRIVILAGLFEKDYEDKICKTYVCVDGNGLVSKYRKLHPFVNKFLTPGDSYVVFDLFGWECGILICYDNNVIENVRATVLLGADIIAECRTLGDDFVTATLTPEKLTQSGGYRYLKARRPNLYRAILGQPHKPDQKVIWLDSGKKSRDIPIAYP